MNTRALSSRLANHVDPQPEEQIVQPAEHVDTVSIERGIDAPVVDLIEEINGENETYNTLRADASALRDIAVSLEEFTLLAMEGINEETGLEAQTLMAIQYGANQHLRRVGEVLEFKSLEDAEKSDLQKTVLSVESLGDALGKIWDGIKNVAKRAAQAVLAFMGHMKSFIAKMKEKANTLKSQLMAIDVDATGNITSSAAKRLYYGDKTFRQLNDVTGSFFSASSTYLTNYVRNTVPESKAIVKKVTSFDSNGMPTVDPKEVGDFIMTEEKRRSVLLDIGYGGRPRSSELHDKEANLRVDYSKGLPGGYRFVSTQPILNTASTAVGDALMVMDEASFDLETDKNSSAPSELPVLSRADAIKQCDQITDFCDQYLKALDISFDAGEQWWNVVEASDKFEEAMERIQVLSGGEMKKLQELPEMKEAFGRGAKVGIKFLTGSAIANALVALGISGDFGLAVITFAGVYIGYIIPAVLIGGALGMLFRSMMTKDGKPSELYFKSSDPNAPLLSLMRGLATTGSWLGMYAVDTFYALGEYFSKLAPAMLEHASDSAKAHLAAQKAANSTQPAQA